MKLHRIVIICLVSFGLGCASMVSGSLSKVSISSDPTPAKFKVYDDWNRVVQQGKTPAMVGLERGQGFFQRARYRIETEAEGCDPASAMLNGSINPWYFGNAIFGGFLGFFIIDPLNGAMWKLDRRPPVLVMDCEGGTK